MACALRMSLPNPSPLPPGTQNKDWNAILRHHARLKNDRAILATFAQMEAFGAHSDRIALPVVLKACAALREVDLGRSVHSSIAGTDLVDDARVRTALIDFYCKCGFLDDAFDLFDEMAKRDLVSWNTMISGCTGNGQHKDSILLYLRMRRDGLRPNSVTLVSLISACAELDEFRLGQAAHCYSLRNGILDLNPYVGTSLICLYSRFDIQLSRNVFEVMKRKSTVSWNALIDGYLQISDFSEVLHIFLKMLVDKVSPDSVTFLAVLQSCGGIGCLTLAKQVHQFVVKYGFSSDEFVGNALIDMYGNCGHSEYASLVFQNGLTRDVASWNAMISAFRNCLFHTKAFGLFSQMQFETVKPDTTTISLMFSICAQCGCIMGGRQLHAYAIKRGMACNTSLDNALLSMYVDMNIIASAIEIFNGMVNKNVISWNILIMGLINHGLTSQAWDLLRKMQQTETKPNSFSMVSLLAGCRDSLLLNFGRSIHGYVIRHGLDINPSLCTALSDMYMNCEHELAAAHMFWGYSDRDLICWNTMIANYTQNGEPNEAITLFYQMQLEREPDAVTMINILPSCAQLGNLLLGRSIHAYVIRRELGLPLNNYLGNALLTMYAKCGSIRSAELIFRNLVQRDIISWNAMIAAYGIHGQGEDALSIFYELVDDGQRPTGVTFVSLLSAFSHCGMVEKGWKIFHAMNKDYNIPPDVVHYACMVDLLGRAGNLDKAKEVVHLMPLEPDASLWRALLSSCRVFHNVELASAVGEKLFELEPMNIANYILLSNIYAAVGNWEDVNTLRTNIKEKGLEKTPGNSWINIKNQVQSFTAGDK
ncbi:putative pentatricopeptide repeat-containing protein At3g01580 [Zingiber officinale]|uniref:putative pentatricopeptide repeat-containing protein At3g01580 n=1 Tax=Zingiber officinale TaxID=94328 RepID=UPI001C4D3860|nr:putative pentatricopeptide repeat-containing protein At3g01580 [Zingiber officinale]XP_042417982.1 putative pentatricopeptide repeat-containing protein At3g01580 [Zingiber officinale]XP_042417983.1 putative pentatricopeptide repeat-containing protein At3g01580 [Zingiber officinale]XP_042417984.1 putative pentatricopeptide repeat-containing protein At3g01580 [Zingiber officinale]XP_042417985.1 putative pentatricopeptide repeat-containing protein At3g01580 [Zingiber officinale]